MFGPSGRKSGGKSGESERDIDVRDIDWFSPAHARLGPAIELATQSPALDQESKLGPLGWGLVL